MTDNASRFSVDPWQLCETSLDLNALAPSESLFALSNGHIGIRGNFDEGDPAGLPGTYLNSFYESRPLPYAEAGYGYPETGQTIVNVTDGRLIRLVVDDEPFDVRYGRLHRHTRTLDLRAGVLRREVDWESPAGRRIIVRSTRLVSLSQRAIMAIHYEVEALDQPARVVLQSELVANEPIPAQSSDPRVASMLESPLEPIEADSQDNRTWLIHRTRASDLRVAASMDHIFDHDAFQSRVLVHDNWARLTAGRLLEPGERCGLDKFVAYGWSSTRTTSTLRDQVDAALILAVRGGWEQLLAEQRGVLDDFWESADITIECDPAIQQAARFALFHTFQAAARAEGRAIPAKGLTGPGYDGHAFWDTEQFVLPVLVATAPAAAADALKWRASTLDLARERATTLRLSGATFPWRTIRGQECSGYWPAGTAAFHVNSDIAFAVLRQLRWTDDDDFARETAIPILVETARMWCSLGYHGSDGRFHIDGVTGPDEYSAVVDDNIYTNLSAKVNLLGAVSCCERWPDGAAALQVGDGELAAWRAAGAAIAVPFDAERNVHSQDKDFTSHALWDFERSARSDGYPLLLHDAYFDIYRKQVVKQADLMLALHWCGDEFTLEEKARAFAYYEPLTVRDSSLSACTQAVVAAEVGQLELANDYLNEAAMMDLRDLEHNTGDGLHIASLAGSWLAIVAGFGGLRDHNGELSLRPQLPASWSSYSFRFRWRGSRMMVSVTSDNVTYEVIGDDDPVELKDWDEPVTIKAGAPVTRPALVVQPLTEQPKQPIGREPISSKP